MRESDAIVIAQELGSDLLLMDERKGRQIASSLGLNTVGLLGILVDAKRTGHIQQVEPLLDASSTRRISGLGHDFTEEC